MSHYDAMALHVVLNTDVVVAGFASAIGASRRLLLGTLDGEVRLLLSTLLLEYEAVPTRPAMLVMAGVSVEGVLAALDELAGRAPQSPSTIAGDRRRATRTTISCWRWRSTAAPMWSHPST